MTLIADPYAKRGSRRMIETLGVVICATSWLACDSTLPCPTCTLLPVHVVVTIDDGPLLADLPAPTDSDANTELKPLRDILAALKNRAATAVFFITPRTEQAASDYKATLAQGLSDIHFGGHVLGYHAFVHDPGIWINPLLPAPFAELMMNRDLDRLGQWLDEVLPPLGASRTDWFQPVFRQPYGGAGFFVYEGVAVAAARSLTYRGYWIDSGDWVNNADADPAIRQKLNVTTENEQDSFVRAQLHSGVLANQGRDLVDVLLHVNELTAAHVGDWLDQIAADYVSLGSGPVQFDVPDRYLQTTDPFVDPGVGVQVASPLTLGNLLLPG